MKLKEWLNKQRIMIGGIVLGVFCIGTTGMIYATYQDRKHQESQVIESAMPTGAERLIDEANESVDKANKPEQLAVDKERIELGSYEVILEGEQPTDATISMEQATQKALEEISKTTGEDFTNAKIYMSYYHYSGITSGKVWEGIVDIGDTKKFTFEVSDPSGKVGNIRTYYREAGEKTWRRQLEDGTIIKMLEEKSLPSFTNLEVNLEGGMKVDIFPGDKYMLFAEWKGEKYELDYEVADNTLYVKDENNGWNNVVKNDDSINRFILWIPETARLENVTINNNAGYNNISSINAHQMNLISDSGTTVFSEVNADEVNITCHTGSVDIESSKMKNLIAKDMSSGSFLMQQCELEQADIAAETGNVEIEKTKCDNMNIEVSVGNIALGKELKGEITAKTHIGNISIEEKDSAECVYHISVELGNTTE